MCGNYILHLGLNIVYTFSCVALDIVTCRPLAVDEVKGCNPVIFISYLVTTVFLFFAFHNLGRRGRRPLRFVPQSNVFRILHFAFCILHWHRLAPRRAVRGISRAEGTYHSRLKARIFAIRRTTRRMTQYTASGMHVRLSRTISRTIGAYIFALPLRAYTSLKHTVTYIFSP